MPDGPGPDDPAAGGGKQDDPQGGQPAGGGEPKTFTQEELDRTISERLRREREKYSDYEDLKQKASQFDELAESQKTDLQKAQDAAADAETRATSLERQLQETRVSATVATAASAKGFKYPDKVARLLDWSQLEFEEDGTPKNLEPLLEKLAEEIPDLVGQGPPPSFDGGARTPAPNGQSMNDLLRKAAGRA